MRWLLTGDEFSAAEALRIGLIQEVVPDGGQFERALFIAGRIAAQAPLAVMATRRNAAIAVRDGAAAARLALMEDARRLMHTQDAAEGLASFVERREARFKGL
jgi:enoyl-CoA hydratase/carnithine racemase